jgi:predicted RNA-binding Zn ribbon-like protein
VDFNSHQDAVVMVAVDLVNATTPGHRHGKPFAEPHGADLVAAIRGVLPNAQDLDHQLADKLAGHVRRLRGVFEAVERDDVDAAAGEVNALLDQLRPSPFLDKHDGEPWHLHFHGRHDDFADGWAGPCTIALATVLGSDYAGRLGVCSAPECDRVYVDVSRNGTRRFCSTACQNRVKAAAHRARAGSLAGV